MYGLTSTLSTAAQALNAESGAIAITNTNIANVNTQGYSRQLVNLSPEALNTGSSLQDNGVSFGGFTSVRDEVLQLGINQKTSDAASFNAQAASWSQVESAFSNTTSGLGSAMSTLFSSLSTLSASPTSAGPRQAAYVAASQLVDAFHQAASSLTSAQSAANASVSGTVTQINDLTSQIAALDGQLAGLQASGQDGGTVQDQRDQLTTQLAQLTGVSSIATESNPTLTLPNGTALVSGNVAYALQTTQGTDGQTHVLNAEGVDVTADLTGGSLGGALTMRDQSLPALSTSLDQLATQFASAMNTAQAQGFDQNGLPGQALFGLPSTATGAAAGIQLGIPSASALALSADGSSGGSGNLANLLAVQTQALPSGQTAPDAYAGFVQRIGSSSAAVTSTLTATNAALNQLTTQQGAESGVSVDEETTNLLRYQQAYSAAAHVITTVNDLFSIVLNMGTVTG